MPTRAAISPRSQPSRRCRRYRRTGNILSSCLEQIEGHKQPEEVAPRCQLPDSARDDPEQRSEDQIGECAARPPSALHSRWKAPGLRPCSHTPASETKAHVNHIRNHGGRNPQQRGEQGRLQFLSTCPPREWGWNFRASSWTSGIGLSRESSYAINLYPTLWTVLKCKGLAGSLSSLCRRWSI